MIVVRKQEVMKQMMTAGIGEKRKRGLLELEPTDVHMPTLCSSSKKKFKSSNASAVRDLIKQTDKMTLRSSSPTSCKRSRKTTGTNSLLSAL